jgi:hypothetical protein
VGGELLHARLSGPVPAGTGVGAALLHGIDPSSPLLEHGVRLELADLPSDGEVRHTYGAAPFEASFVHWERERTLAFVPQAEADAASVELVGEPAVSEAIAVRLLVHAPERVTPDRLARVLDGVLCALQDEGALGVAHPGHAGDRCVAADLRVLPGPRWTIQGDVVTVLPF